MNYLPKHSRDHADSEYVSCVGVDRMEQSLSVTNKQTNRPIHKYTQ